MFPAEERMFIGGEQSFQGGEHSFSVKDLPMPLRDAAFAPACEGLCSYKR